MSRTFTVAFVFAACLPVLACSANAGSFGGADPTSADGGPAATSADFCGTYCAKAHQCDNSVDEQTCANECANTNGTTLKKLRPDVVSGVSQCVTGTDCKTVLAGDAVSACVDEVLAGIAPDKAAQDFCAGYGSVANKCGGSVDKSQCLVFVKRYSDATLKSASACFAKTCSDVQACVDATLGIESSGGGGGTCTAQITTSSTTCNACLQNNCCAEDNACANDASCTNLLSCVNGCKGSSSCEQACASKYPSGVSKLNAWTSCASSNCNAECY